MTNRREEYWITGGGAMAKAVNIYVVEDEKEINDIVVMYLSKEGFKVKPFYRGDTALEDMLKSPPDLAILDIMLPGVDGMEILRQVRKKHYFPVMFLTSKKDEVDRILGLELGADDYVTKPFSPRELVAKVRSLFRRIEYVKTTVLQDTSPDKKIATRYLTLDVARRKLYAGDDSIELTTTEFSLLELLMKSPGRIFLREELLEYIWGNDFDGSSRTVDVHVRNLRQKIKQLAGSADYIRSVRGVGYAFED